MELLDCMVCVRGIIGVDRFIRSQSRQRDFCYETELEVEVVFSNVIERYGTEDVFPCRKVITYLQTSLCA